MSEALQVKYVEGIWEGNQLYRMDEMTRDMETSTSENWLEHYTDDKYSIKVHPMALQELKHNRYLNFCLSLRDDSGKILRYCHLKVEGGVNDTSQGNSPFTSRHKDLVSPSFKDLDNSAALKVLLMSLVGSKNVLDLQNSKIISEFSCVVGGKSAVTLGRYSSPHDLCKFATLMGMDLPNAELILTVDCFDKSNNSPAVIERNTQPYMLVIRSFGGGFFKWENDSREPHKVNWVHSLSLPTFEQVGGKTSNLASIGFTFRTDGDKIPSRKRINREMNKMLQERI